MRFLVKSTIQVEMGNDAVLDGTIGEKIGRIISETKPEAVYFTVAHGQRTIYMVVDLQNASDLPSVVEPWWLTFDCDVEVMPVMVPEDLERADLERISKTYGQE